MGAEDTTPHARSVQPLNNILPLNSPVGAPSRMNTRPFTNVAA